MFDDTHGGTASISIGIIRLSSAKPNESCCLVFSDWTIMCPVDVVWFAPFVEYVPGVETSESMIDSRGHSQSPVPMGMSDHAPDKDR